MLSPAASWVAQDHLMRHPAPCQAGRWVPGGGKNERNRKDRRPQQQPTCNKCFECWPAFVNIIQFDSILYHTFWVSFNIKWKSSKSNFNRSLAISTSTIYIDAYNCCPGVFVGIPHDPSNDCWLHSQRTCDRSSFKGSSAAPSLPDPQVPGVFWSELNMHQETLRFFWG